MILAIDVGNTDTVVAVLDGGDVVSKHRYPTAKNESEDYHKRNIQKATGAYLIDFVIISCVVPCTEDILKSACRELFGITAVFVSCELDCGITIKYDEPQKLGADLICVGAGAVKKYGSPVIVIDIGTATTFSVINKNNEYLGGMIAAGPNTSIKALSSMTAKLPAVQPENIGKFIGTNTQDCIKIGAVTAHACMIDSMIDRIVQSLGVKDIKLVATGGLAETVLSSSNHNIIYDDNLIFSGMYEIASKQMHAGDSLLW